MLNKVELIGNLGSDLQLNHTSKQKEVCTMSVATNNSYRDAEGKLQQEVEWHRVVVWGKQAKVCCENLHKGSQVYIEGRLRTRRWNDSDNKPRQTKEVVARYVRFLGANPNKQQQEEPPKDENQEDPRPSDMKF